MADPNLTEKDLELLDKQNSRIVPEFKANKLELEAQKNWDLFYKRNETNFFKDRHWTTREFEELLGDMKSADGKNPKVLLEVGCGVGNLVFPLLELKLPLYIYCCDFSPRGVQFVRDHQLYDEERMKAFQCDITTGRLVSELGPDSVDLITCIFVLSAIHPDKHQVVFTNLAKVLRPGGMLLFRDYGLYDMAMIRFKPGSKIAENFYTRQDGTRSYFFQTSELSLLGQSVGLDPCQVQDVPRRTVNMKEGVDVARNFVQAKFKKPL